MQEESQGIAIPTFSRLKTGLPASSDEKYREKMRKFISKLSSHLRQVITVSLALIAILVISFPATADELRQPQQIITPDDGSETVDQNTVKKIQRNAEDFGGEDIGDTGLKNIRKLGENIPETADLIRRQNFGDKSENSLDSK